MWVSDKLLQLQGGSDRALPGGRILHPGQLRAFAEPVRPMGMG